MVPNVLETMLEIHPSPTGQGLPSGADRISAIIGIGGDEVHGMIYVHFPRHLGEEVAGKLLDGCVGAELGDGEVNDVVGEMCNMMAGGLKADLAEVGFEAGISPPSIIRGKGFTIDPEPGMEVSHFGFLCGKHVLDLEIHLRIES